MMTRQTPLVNGVFTLPEDLKIDGWKTTFLLGYQQVSGTMLVSGVFVCFLLWKHSGIPSIVVIKFTK